MKKLLLLGVIVIGCLPNIAAANNEAGLWTTVGDWQIRVDPTLGHGCFMMASYRDGTVLRIGIDNNNHAGYMWLGNAAWRSLQVGQRYQIDVAFDGAALRPWASVALKVDDSVFLLLPFSNADVWKAVSAANVVSFSYHGTSLTQLPLTGTTTAVNTIFQCQQQFPSPQQSADPFAASESSDPFAK